VERHGGRKRDRSLQREIRQRILDFVLTQCDGNQTKFARRANVPRTTVTGWLSKKSLHTPDVPQLVDLATQVNMNLNWLLIGEPPMLRGAPHPEEKLPQRLRAVMVAQLASEFGEAEAVKQLLEVLLPPPDELVRMVLTECREWVRASVRSRMMAFPGLLTDAMARVAGHYNERLVFWGTLPGQSPERDDIEGA
jgi:hypothetical protein